MWICTEIGFFSATAAYTSETDKRPSPDKIMVRARLRRHLENLKTAFPSLRKYDILETTNRDYFFRIIVPKSEWKGIVGELVDFVDYTNFKGAVAKTGDLEYCDALHAMWGNHYAMQRRVHGSGIYDRPAIRRRPLSEDEALDLLAQDIEAGQRVAERFEGDPDVMRQIDEEFEAMRAEALERFAQK